VAVDLTVNSAQPERKSPNFRCLQVPVFLVSDPLAKLFDGKSDGKSFLSILLVVFTVR